MIEITIDFETFSELDVTVVGAWNYSHHPTTEPLILTYKINDEPTLKWDYRDGARLPERLFQILSDTPKDELRVIAHNYWFEFCVWKFCCVPKLNWPVIHDDCWYDTQQMCGLATVPLGLDVATKCLNITEKLSTGKELIKFFSMPQKDGSRNYGADHPEKFQNFIEYGIVDTDSCREIYDVVPKFKPREMDFVRLSHRLNCTGIPVDVESAHIILKKVIIERESYTRRISELTNGTITTVNQTQRMQLWLKNNHDIEMPNFQAGTVQDALDGHYGELSDEAQSLLEMRSTGGKSSTAKYEKLLNTASCEIIDGKECWFIYGAVLFHGARTGRYVGRAFQPQNLPKPSVKYESMEQLVEDLVTMTNEEINEKYGSFMKAASSAVRGMIKAPDGYEIMGADYAAIEARVLFWLADCLRGLALYHKGQDPYIDMAAVIYVTQYQKVDDEQRWLGKQAILGCGYGLGWRGFINTCANWGVEIKESLSQDAVNSYRNTYHEVPTLWTDLDKKSLEAVRTGKLTVAAKGKIQFKTYTLKNKMRFLFMKLPSGRFMCYPGVRIEKTKTPWGQMRDSITYRALENNIWVRTNTYGGKLAENACQAIARDIMMEGTWNADHEGLKPFIQVHDELLSLVKKGQITLDEYEKLICDPMPEWSKGLPLKAEGKILDRYQKL